MYGTVSLRIRSKFIPDFTTTPPVLPHSWAIICYTQKWSFSRQTTECFKHFAKIKDEKRILPQNWNCTEQPESNQRHKIILGSDFFFLFFAFAGLWLITIQSLWSSLTTIWPSLSETPSLAQMASARSPAPQTSPAAAAVHWTPAILPVPRLSDGTTSCRISSASSNPMSSWWVDYCQCQECWDQNCLRCGSCCCRFGEPGMCTCPWWSIGQWWMVDRAWAWLWGAIVHHQMMVSGIRRFCRFEESSLKRRVILVWWGCRRPAVSQEFATCSPGLMLVL